MMKIDAISKEIGNNLNLHDTSSIKCKDLKIGTNVFIGQRVKIICSQNVFIGDNVYIGDDVTIILKSISIGEYTKLHNHCLINGKENVEIGDNCWIGQNSILNGESFLKIGNNVGIGTYTSLWTHGYFGQLVDGCNFFSIKPTIIEDDVWLMGSYNTIFPGVTIGHKSILMGTSVVTKSIPCNKIFSGNPAKDITEKFGSPYTKIDVKKQLEIINHKIVNYLIEKQLIFKELNNEIQIDDYGIIFFGQKNRKKEIPLIHSVTFYDEVVDWLGSNDEKDSRFCLKTKTYEKKLSRIEILVKTILNPVTARFIVKQTL